MPGYLLLLAGCLLVTLPIEVAGARVWRRPRRLVRTLAPVIVVFLAWDEVGLRRGHWGFAGAELLGARMPGGLPVEEALFFVTVPSSAIASGLPDVLTRSVVESAFGELLANPAWCG